MKPVIDSTVKPRICAVSYLNTQPLVWGLLHDPSCQGLPVEFALPSVCAQRLQEGQADIGLVPVVELLRQSLEPLPGVGIAARGAVRSILLVSRVPIREIRTVATDTSSRTSVALTRIVLEERYGISPEFHGHPPHLDAMLATADAALIIGDPALRLDPASLPYHVLDLSAEWHALTGLPMVFAVWAARPGFARPEWADLFVRSSEYGRARIDDIVQQQSVTYGIAATLAREYLTRFIHYPIGPAEQQGLHRFLELAQLRENQKEREIVHL